MGSKTNYLENAFLNHVLRNVAYTPPSAIYVGLFTVAPGEAGGGTEISTTSTGYGRQSATFGAAADGSTSNTNVMTFGPALQSWGSVAAFALFDAVTNGNMLYYGTVSSPKTIDTDDKLEIPIGGITVSED